VVEFVGKVIFECFVVGMFLCGGIVAALGLANFAVSTSSNITKQIIGMGLAREGAEAVKNMRDTNWLNGSIVQTCYDFATGTSTASCYPSWLNQRFVLDPQLGNQVGGIDTENGGAAKSSYTVSFVGNNVNFWNIADQSSNYALYYDATGGNQGLYYAAASGTPSGYFRRITLSKAAVAPYTDANYNRVLVTSEVWWNDKKCPTAGAGAPPSSGSCRITLKLFLTNWKNY
jgi:hypothetical protein